jgi:hypothetical protein
MESSDKIVQQDYDDITGVYKISIENELAQNFDVNITPLVEKSLNINKFSEKTTAPSSSSSSSSISNENQYENDIISLALNDNTSSLKVDYIPKGKIITINVSIMW